MPSKTRYLPALWSSLGNIQHFRWKDTFPSGLTGVIFKGWGPRPLFQIQLSMAPSLESDLSYLASLPSNYRPLAHYPSIIAARWLCADLDNRWNIFANPTAYSNIPILCCLFLLFLWWPCCIHLYKLSFVSISCVREWLIIRRCSHSSAVPVARVGVAAGLLSLDPEIFFSPWEE